MPTLAPVTVALARFEDLLGRGLRSLIEEDRSLQLVAADIEPQRISVVLRAHHPCVAIVDLDALQNAGAIRAIAIDHPATRLVVLAEAPSTATAAQLLAFGASACLGKDTQARDVISAIHLASRGLQVIPRAAHPSKPTGSPLLTAREADVLTLLRAGRSNAQIALELQIGVETVRTHARHIYRKLGVGSRRELLQTPSPPYAEDVAVSREPRPTRARRTPTASGGRRRRNWPHV